MASAYLVFFHHRKTKLIVSAGIYSEATPTFSLDADAVPLMAAHAPTFEQAHAIVVDWIRKQSFQA